MLRLLLKFQRNDYVAIKVRVLERKKIHLEKPKYRAFQVH